MSEKYFCPNCGAVVEQGIKFCANCGTAIAGREPAQPTPAAQPYAPSQPYAPVAQAQQPGISPLSRTVALVLCIFIGYMGVHRFYAGKIGTGVLWLLTWGLLGIGVFIDFILILVGSFTDDKGLPIVNW